MGKFVNTRDGRTAVIWLVAWSGVAKTVSYASLLALPTYATAVIALALFCSAPYMATQQILPSIMRLNF